MLATRPPSRAAVDPWSEGGIAAGGRENQLVGQIAEHLVCAELSRRDLITTPLAGNIPTFDVIATNDRCHTIPIQVEATRTDNWRTDAREWPAGSSSWVVMT